MGRGWSKANAGAQRLRHVLLRMFTNATVAAHGGRNDKGLLMGEEWKQFRDTKCDVSACGKVRTRATGILRKIQWNTPGYAQVSIGRKNLLVHRMVCEAHNGPPPEPRYEADHINKDHRDNRKENLRWLSPEDHRLLGCRGEDMYNAKLTEEAVRYIRSTPKIRGSDRKIALELGVSRPLVNLVRNGKIWKHVL